MISVLVNKTFAHRIHLLVKEFVQLKTLIADYPFCVVRNCYSHFACLHVYAPKMKTLWLLIAAFSYKFFGSLSVSFSSENMRAASYQSTLVYIRIFPNFQFLY